MEKTIFLPETIIDAHCHGRDMEESYKTTVEQTLREAKNGNINISVFMPNTNPPIIDLDTLFVYLGLIRKAQDCLGLKKRQYVYFGATDDNLGACGDALKIESVVGLKIYPKGVTTGNKIGVCENSTLRRVLQIVDCYDKVVAFHCDEPEVIAKEGYTVAAEVAYLKKVIGFVQETPKTKVVICHVSCRESAEVILAAQAEGLKIGLELCPHYLWFDDITNRNWALNSNFYHCYNRIRTKEHRLFLMELLRKESDLIFIGSDNAPHTMEEKLQCLGGLPTNQEMVAVVVTLALNMGLSEKQVGNLICYNAANFFGIPVSEKKKEYCLVEKINSIEYNNGKIINPWSGSRLIFPIPVNK